MAGIRPAATYGAEVIGVAPSALRTLRQVAAITRRPKSRGRSLTAVSLTHADPAGRASYAAAARWALEVWRASGHGHTAHSLPTLIAAHDACLPAALIATWPTAKGLVAIAQLEPARSKWSWPAPLEGHHRLSPQPTQTSRTI